MDKKISYDCIVVPASVIPELQAVGVNHHGAPISETSVYTALRYGSNSECAKEIRALAIKRGGRKIVKNQVKFI